MRSRSAGGVLLGVFVFDEFDADHEAASADIADQLEFLGPGGMRAACALPTSAALAQRSSCSMTSRVARAAAMQTGLPPKVEAWEPGIQSMMSARVMRC